MDAHFNCAVEITLWRNIWTSFADQAMDSCVTGLPRPLIRRRRFFAQGRLVYIPPPIGYFDTVQDLFLGRLIERAEWNTAFVFCKNFRLRGAISRSMVYLTKCRASSPTESIMVASADQEVVVPRDLYHVEGYEDHVHLIREDRTFTSDNIKISP